MKQQNDSDSDSTDSETNLGDFEEEAQAPESSEANFPPVAEMRKQKSDYDRQIRPGDTVRDLWGNGWLVVHSKAADTVREYDRNQPDTKKSLLEYEGSKAMGATEEDTVWNCFYLNSNNTLAGGRSGPYGFPEARICRYAYEATDGFKKGRFQEVLQMQILERVAGATLRSGNGNFQGAVESMLKMEFGEDTASEVFELAEAAQAGSAGDDDAGD